MNSGLPPPVRTTFSRSGAGGSPRLPISASASSLESGASWIDSPSAGADDLLGKRSGGLAEIADQRLGVLSRERGELDRLALRPVRPRLEQLRPGEAE